MDYDLRFLAKPHRDWAQIRQLAMERCRRDLGVMKALGVTRADPQDIRARAHSADVKIEEMAALYAEYGIEPMGGMDRLTGEKDSDIAALMDTGDCKEIRRLLNRLEETIVRRGGEAVHFENVYDFLAWLGGGEETAQELAARDTFRLQLLTKRLIDALPPEEARSPAEEISVKLLDRCEEIFAGPYRRTHDAQMKVYTCKAYRRICMLDPMALETARIAEGLIEEIRTYFGIDRAEAVRRYRYLAYQRGARPYDESVCLTMGKGGEGA